MGREPEPEPELRLRLDRERRRRGRELILRRGARKGFLEFDLMRRGDCATTIAALTEAEAIASARLAWDRGLYCGVELSASLNSAHCTELIARGKILNYSSNSALSCQCTM